MKYIFLLCTISMISFSCTKEEKRTIDSCCELSSVQEEIGTDKIYVPNIFTPNGDGISDYFYVQGDGELMEVKNFTIRNNKNEVVFKKDISFVNDYFNGWDGSVDGIIDYGLFSYSFTAESNDGASKFIEGEVCCWICKEQGQIEPESPNNLTNCNFPTQHDGQGGFDPTKSTLESFWCF